MRILITGGSGFIGSRLASELAAPGVEVVLFDSLHPQVHTLRPVEPSGGVTLFPGDVCDSEAWDRCLLLHGPPDAVFHLAAETGTGQSLTQATRHAAANVAGTTQLTDALVRHRCQPGQILLTSSRAVYGEGSWATEDGVVFYPDARSGEQLAAGQWDPISPSKGRVSALPHSSATTWPRPTNVYAATKLAQEHVLEAWCASFGVPLSILRLQNVYGPGQAVSNAYSGVLTHFARQIALGDRIEVYEDGQILRDFVFVGDVVDALKRALALPPRSSRRVDIGGGRSVSLEEVAREMCALAGANAPVVNGQYRLGDVRAAFADVNEAAAALDWEPTTTLTEGLTRLLEWVPTQVDHNSNS